MVGLYRSYMHIMYDSGSLRFSGCADNIYLKCFHIYSTQFPSCPTIRIPTTFFTVVNSAIGILVPTYVSKGIVTLNSNADLHVSAETNSECIPINRLTF